jgi:tetratricopeptide (TPR) repeat protein
VDQTNAAWAVHGVIRPSGDSVEFRIGVIDVTHPRREQQVVEVGVRDSVSVTLDRMARRVSGAVAYELDPYMESIDGGFQPLPSPPTIEAFREHRLGYQAYDRGDAAASHEHHLAAYALDTTLVRALVAAAYMAQNRQVRDSLARFVTARRHLLSRRGQLDLDLLNAELVGDREAAFEAIRASAHIEGGGFSSLLEASFAMRRNLPSAALEATERYDPFPDWRRGEAHHFWLYRTRALHMLGRHKEELAEARAGRERYPTHLGLLTTEIRALAALGRENEVSNRLLEARSLPGIRESEGVVAGMELRAHGFREAAQRVFNETAEWIRRSLVEGQRNGRKRLDLARALYGAERWEEAKEVATVLLSEEPGDPTLLGFLGCTAARMGDSVRAEAFMDRLTREVGPHRIDERYYQMATIASVLSRHDEAMGLLQRAYAEGYSHGLELHQDMNFESIRHRDDFRALLAPKG